jgi:hypothetical protein
MAQDKITEEFEDNRNNLSHCLTPHLPTHARTYTHTHMHARARTHTNETLNIQGGSNMTGTICV